MSNKKRIAKRISFVHKKNYRIVISLDRAGINENKARIVFSAIIKGCNLAIESLKELGDICKSFSWTKHISVSFVASEHMLGLDFKLQNDEDLEKFIYEVKTLSANQNLNFFQLCRMIPKERRFDCIGLMRVGFTLEEAIQELKEAYKF